MPEAPAFIHEMKYAGKSCPDKLAAIRREMKKSDADVLLVSALDEIAWKLNIRGNDVHCNPVVVSLSLIHISSNLGNFLTVRLSRTTLLLRHVQQLDSHGRSLDYKIERLVCVVSDNHRKDVYKRQPMHESVRWYVHPSSSCSTEQR